jgi:hypothetical protein
MGYTSTADPIGQLRMSFTSKQAAVAFAEKQGRLGGIVTVTVVVVVVVVVVISANQCVTECSTQVM